jgi:hypothetical protein
MIWRTEKEAVRLSNCRPCGLRFPPGCLCSHVTVADSRSVRPMGFPCGPGVGAVGSRVYGVALESDRKYRPLASLGSLPRDRGVHPLLQRFHGDGREIQDFLSAREAQSTLNARDAMHERPHDTRCV